MAFQDFVLGGFFVWGQGLTFADCLTMTKCYYSSKTTTRDLHFYKKHLKYQNMENLDVDLKIQELKAAATNQTEFVQGLLIYLLIQSKTLDDIIENFGTEDLK